MFQLWRVDEIEGAPRSLLHRAMSGRCGDEGLLDLFMAMTSMRPDERKSAGELLSFPCFASVAATCVHDMAEELDSPLLDVDGFYAREVLEQFATQRTGQEFLVEQVYRRPYRYMLNDLH